MAEFQSGQRQNAWAGADPKKWAREEEAKRRIGEIGRSLPIFPARLELAILAARCCAARPLSPPEAAASSQGGSSRCSRPDFGTSFAASSSNEALDTAADSGMSTASLPRRIKLRAGSSTASITKDEVDLGVAGLEEVGIAHESLVGNVLVYSAEARVAVWILTYGIPPADPALVPVQAPPTPKADSGSLAAARTPQRVRTIVTFYHAALGDDTAGFENILGDWLSGTGLTTMDSTFSQTQRHAGPRVHVGVYKMWRAVHAKVDQCLFRIRQHCENCAQQLILTGHGIGGSVASIAALELMETAVPRSWSDCQTYLKTGQIESSGMPNFVFTFGSPSAGDETFCSALDSSFCRWHARKKPGMHLEDYERNLRVLRFVKPCDLAPSIPGCLYIACQAKTMVDFFVRSLPALVLYIPVSVIASISERIARAFSGKVCLVEEDQNALLLRVAPQPGCLVWLRDSTTAGARLYRPTCLDVVYRTCLKIVRHRAHKCMCSTAGGYLASLERLKEAQSTCPTV